MSVLAERLAFLRGPGGVEAGAYWLTKCVFRAEVHGVHMLDLHHQHAAAPCGYKFLALAEKDHIRSIPPSLLEKIDAQSGSGVRSLVNNGTMVFALVKGLEVACQLNISPRQAVVDSPISLRFELQEQDAFLGFLYTHGPFRRRGLAEQLLRLVADDLAERGFKRCVCHIRMTNVPSLAAFRRARWHRVGSIVTTRGGRLLAVAGCTAAGIRIRTR